MSRANDNGIGRVAEGEHGICFREQPLPPDHAISTGPTLPAVTRAVRGIQWPLSLSIAHFLEHGP
eukprot:1764251-Rhodomonas_salina.2